MIDPSISIVIATIGRATLNRSLESIAPQLGKSDRVLLVSDGEYNDVTRIWRKSSIRDHTQPFVLFDGPHNDYGMYARNWVLPLIRTSHVMYLDDDDTYVPDALEYTRTTIREHPDNLILFRVVFPDGSIFWKEPKIELGNVSTQIVVHPAGKYGVWGDRYEGDYDFIESTSRLYDKGPVWNDKVIARRNH